jgi:hypothetical protein
MKKKVTIIFLSALLILPGLASAVSEKDFKADTTEQVVNLCTADPGGSLVPGGDADWYKIARSRADACMQAFTRMLITRRIF